MYTYMYVYICRYISARTHAKRVIVDQPVAVDVHLLVQPRIE